MSNKVNNLSEEENRALEVLAKHNNVVYINKAGHGVGNLHLNGDKVNLLTSLELKAETDDTTIHFIKVKTGIAISSVVKEV